MSTGARRLVWRPGVEAMLRGRKRYVERLHAMGLKPRAGRKPGRWWKRPANEQERVMREVEDTLERLPEIPDKPVDQMTDAQLLHANVREGLKEMLRVFKQPMKVKQHEDDELSAADLKLQRLKVDATTSTARLFAHVQEAALRQQSDDKVMDELLAEIAKARRDREGTCEARAGGPNGGADAGRQIK